jgi:hypothetical protein
MMHHGGHKMNGKELKVGLGQVLRRIVLVASAVFVVVLLCWLFRWDYYASAEGAPWRINRFTGRVQQHWGGKWGGSER